jgi:hypothetical protein
LAKRQKSGYVGLTDDITNGQSTSGLYVAPKSSEFILGMKLGKPLIAPKK